MKPHLRVVLFGFVSGLLWSIVPAFLSEIYKPFGQMVTVCLSGIICGIIVSYILSGLLRNLGWKGSLVAGMLSLPLGAFVFGITISSIQLIVRSITGIAYRFVEHGFTPLQNGLEYAFVSSVSVFAIALFPMAILTTFMLKKVCGSAQPSAAADAASNGPRR